MCLKYVWSRNYRQKETVVKKKFFKEWCLEELKAMKSKIFSLERYRKICMILSVCGQMMKEMAAAAAAKSLQLCPTLCDPIDGSPPGSPVPGILQARTLEWVAMAFCNAWKWKVKVKSFSRVRLLATPWTAAHQTPLSMDFPGKSTGVGCRLQNICLSEKPHESNVHTGALTQRSKLWNVRGYIWTTNLDR